MASVAIATVLIVVFGLERLSGGWQHDVTNLRHAWGWSLVSLHDGEWWRILTPALLHSDVASTFGPLGTEHLVANVFAMMLFAPRVERRHGRAVVVAAFFALHLAAFSVWAITQTPGSYFGVGASGAIVGLAVAAVMDGVRRGQWRYVVSAAAFALWWWWPSGALSSDQVHLAGAIAGALFGLLSVWPWTSMAIVALTGVVATAIGEPDLPSTPRRLACPDVSYGWSTGARARLLVRNERAELVDVYWVRPDGGRDFLAPLRPDEYLVEGSYVGHRFVVTTDRGACLGVLEVR